MRLFAIVQWHHFAYMVISIALLGYGASGTFLALTQDWLKPRFVAGFAANAALFGVSALVSFALGERVPFNALEVIWDPGQLLYLAVFYVLFTVPFFCGANCIGLAFVRFGDQIGRIYRYDLVGAGAGALGMVATLFVLSPSNCLRLVAGLGIAAAALAYCEWRASSRRWVAAGLFIAAILLPIAAPQSWIALRLSEYKGLSIALQTPGTQALGEYSSPLGLLTVVRSSSIPFRHAPGLSLNSTLEPPPQLGVFTDGDALSVITSYDGRREALAYLDYTTSALPYHLLENPSVLILGAGGGSDVLQAMYHNAARIDAVELNPQFLRIVEKDHRDFAGGVYARPEVQVHVAEARGFVARSMKQWDLIQIPLLDSPGAAAAGVQSLNESYVYTVEAFGAYLGHLKPGGFLAITRWLKLPPRDSLKLLVTAVVALEREGITDPTRRVTLTRSWNTTTLLLKNGAFLDQEIAEIRDFTEERSFDLAYYPGITSEETNRFNLLQAPYFFEGATALVSPRRAEFIERYKFDLAPASDDRPYFFDFFKWRSLPEFLALRTQGGAALLEWGYPILFATLAQAATLSVVLILLPLGLRRREAMRHSDRGRIMAYFFGLGLAFLFVEIAFIQRFIVFLSHPLYAVAVVLCSFLVFAGLGSGYAPRLAKRLNQRHTAPSRKAFRISAIDISVLAIVAVALLYLWLLPPLFERLMPWPDMARVLVSLVLIAPLAFFMGMPFPLGLSRVSARIPELVPWAWGVNGCASVLSAVLAMILSVHFGFTAVVAIAIVLYLAAAIVFREPPADWPPTSNST
ncbi:MAG: SAM-dependent methyltransferase [Hyphomicrobium sp.]